ncbi:hypothetical protein SAMN02746066_03424 [Anaerosporobacter mobilis DSM 15930]|jgi:glucan phosphoethanolaminetransferase (alkaline phosphatase superfamily)|uniref:Uncharacterized protein n=1 Tax=Anaerosporobacter mobilis DSM 15930 TaxID=1120996 RepID=A0A1M7LV99_9FIRM|nr:hypothetical protein [Anaerosporobacter mobilis]SHM82046.1 hypothetical protein SAMN02746066_03424 [Anaerosporobacter mobilis DSM 15930]
MEINITTILMAIALLAFVVSVFTEVTKNISIFKKIPTDMQVLTVSVLLTVISYFAYVSYSSAKVIWYYVIGSIIIGLFVAFVAMYGWDKFSQLWDRFKSTGGGNNENK